MKRLDETLRDELLWIFRERPSPETMIDRYPNIRDSFNSLITRAIDSGGGLEDLFGKFTRDPNECFSNFEEFLYAIGVSHYLHGYSRSSFCVEELNMVPRGFKTHSSVIFRGEFNTDVLLMILECLEFQAVDSHSIWTFARELPEVFEKMTSESLWTPFAYVMDDYISAEFNAVLKGLRYFLRQVDSPRLTPKMRAEYEDTLRLVARKLPQRALNDFANVPEGERFLKYLDNSRTVKTFI